jgi:gamma-glutamyl:cysteine ligase YbdK (ATP-grasp superfamily)
MNATLLGTAMHPWMDPQREMTLWPHENSDIYAAFNRVFDCRGHGWANLQSMHINLPFAGDEEFARLHAAVRLVLPILPALAASSPVMEARVTGLLDNRLDVYRRNSRRIPQVAGRVIPEQAFNRAEYDRLIFRPMYAAIAPHDPDGVLQNEFLNARGAIARFSRGSIEIRVIDLQECPAADLAIAQLTIAVLRMLVDERWSDLPSQQALEIDPLEHVLLSTIRMADEAVIDDPRYLQVLGVTDRESIPVGELWESLARRAEQAGLIDASTIGWARGDQGPLARRVVARLAGEPDHDAIRAAYGELARCLAQGERFGASR